MPNAAELIARHGKLKSARSNWESQWADCLAYCLPVEGDALGYSADGETRKRPVDGTGIRSNSILAAGLFSHTYSSDKWFSLRPSDDRLAESDETKRWFADARDAALRAIQRSNLASVLHSALEKFTCLGTAVLYSEWAGDELVFKDYSITDCCITESAAGLVNALYRSFSFTAAQAMEEFSKDGDNVHKTIVEAAKTDPYRRFKFLHCVFPRTSYDADKLTRENKPWASIYVDVENSAICRESGFDSFPFSVPRFAKTSSECLGRSPAMDAMPDVKMLQRAVADYIDAQEMAIFPPYWVSDEELASALSTKLQPGAFLPVDPSRPPVRYETGARFDAIMEFLQRTQNAVESAFYVQLFLSDQEEGDITATEVRARQAEKTQVILPVVSRLQSELYSPLIERVVSLLIAAGVIAPPPAELSGAEYRVVYQTRLDQKVKVLESDAVLRVISAVSQIAASQQQIPGVALLFDLQKLARHLADAEGVPSTLIRSEAEVKKLAEELQAAQAQQDAAAAMQGAVRPVDLAKAPEPGSPMNPEKRAA